MDALACDPRFRELGSCEAAYATAWEADAAAAAPGLPLDAEAADVEADVDRGFEFDEVVRDPELERELKQEELLAARTGWQTM
jgi:hypothetical protein